LVSQVALAMFLDDDRNALVAYLAGDRGATRVFFLISFGQESVLVAIQWLHL
jgi:hypothetical protein